MIKALLNDCFSVCNIVCIEIKNTCNNLYI